MFTRAQRKALLTLIAPGAALTRAKRIEADKAAAIARSIRLSKLADEKTVSPGSFQNYKLK